MMKILLLLLAYVAYAAASSCGPLERLKVKTQWVQVYGGNAKQRTAFGEEVWGYVFEKAPKAMDLFTRVRGDNIHSPEFRAHMVRVFGGLDIVISLLTDEDTLNGQLGHLRDQHNDRGIAAENFDLFFNALKHAIPKHAHFFDQDAWAACYDVIKTGITKDLSSE